MIIPTNSRIWSKSFGRSALQTGGLYRHHTLVVLILTRCSTQHIIHQVNPYVTQHRVYNIYANLYCSQNNPNVANTNRARERVHIRLDDCISNTARFLFKFTMRLHILDYIEKHKVSRMYYIMKGICDMRRWIYTIWDEVALCVCVCKDHLHYMVGHWSCGIHHRPRRRTCKLCVCVYVPSCESFEWA